MTQSTQPNTYHGYTREQLQALFTYDPATGILSWKVAPEGSTKRAGENASYIWTSNTGHKYAKVTMRRFGFSVHKLIWLMETGILAHRIIHLNKDTLDNRWENLDLTRPWNQEEESMEEFIRSTFAYDPEEGTLTRIRSTGAKAIKGQQADIAAPRGLARGVNLTWGKRVYAHQIIWLLHTGEFPPPAHFIRYVDGDRGNLRWENLKLCKENVREGGKGRGRVWKGGGLTSSTPTCLPAVW